ncbi:MAG TPA: cell wall metabolism sensor histidine kinase WalK [Bacillota bacterium]|nr:cell wall metabolism sensor histidine kinase WalK [Bacillota bacterium]
MRKVGFFRSIQLKFIIIYILLLMIAIQVTGSYFATQLENNLLDNFMEVIDDRSDLLSYNLEQTLNKDRSDEPSDTTLEQEVQMILETGSTEDITNLEVVNMQGRVLGVIGANETSSHDIIGKKTTKDAIQKALLLGTVQENTLLDSKTRDRLYVKTVPLFEQDNKDSVIGVIYLEASMEGVYGELQNINGIFFKGSMFAIFVSALLGILVARTITKPIKEMRGQAQKMATGDFSQKVNVYSSDEIGQLAGTFNDMNDRLQYSYAAIEKEQRKLSSILANMSDGVIASDESGRVTLMNDAAGKLLGHNPEDCLGDDILDLLHLDEKLIDLTDLPESGSMILDFSDDDIFLIQANFSVVVDDDDQVTGTITVINDVTEQEKLERERREFVSNVSHELRTPLTTMRSYIETLTEGAWKNEQIAPKFLKVAQNETERMIRMVNDLLQLSKMDNKDYMLHRERIEFIDYFHQIIDRFDMNRPRHITLKRDLPKEKYVVWIDQDKMTQVLDNILSNAIKYSPDGGTITCRVVKKNHQLLVSVADEGMGISYERLEKIFERFYRADKSRTRELGGTGLGLAISKELVEAHQGKIWATSREGKGTTIFFTLPLMSKKRREHNHEV